MIIETYSYPRAAVIGNPSDGYFGKTIAFVFSNFVAKVQLYQTPQLEIKPQRADKTTYNNLDELVDNINFAGYYGGMRLIKGIVKVFYEYCKRNNIKLASKNFTITYNSNIPLRLGLAGSSAILTACLKALCLFYEVYIEPAIFANLVLSVETNELGISAGLQDRVAQAYEKPVFMNFDKKIMEKEGYGKYEVLHNVHFPNFYIAFRKNLSEGTETVHNNLKARFDIKEAKVLQAMKRWAQITEEFKAALEKRDKQKMHELINENFDLRRNLIPVSQGNIEMVELARSVGASAKFTGSGGAIIGTYADEIMYNKLHDIMNNNEIEVIKPNIINNN
ncbi:GHMP kinase [Maribellus comscasis]|uniref:GHMP kinase n=1 Tax=Maribellus comscasis TaxID=2681766 RepID=A0A6I6K3L7_9BACT|nr:GHMP kinase [Maribellus comscasis]QGY46183.1 GHMP kinase [Maribellus comscasis]